VSYPPQAEELAASGVVPYPGDETKFDERLSGENLKGLARVQSER
jgi:hypothetical protein